MGRARHVLLSLVGVVGGTFCWFRSVAEIQKESKFTVWVNHQKPSFAPNYNSTPSLYFLDPSKTYSPRALQTIEENDRNTGQNKRVLTHFFAHIPKTGGQAVFNEWNALLRSTREYQAMHFRDKFRACDMGSVKRRTFERGFSRRQWGQPCAFYMSEHVQESRKSQHTYTVLRDPKSHLVSLFFHCKESFDHIYARHKIAKYSFAEWLEEWVRLAASGRHNTTNSFGCYNPIERESKAIMSMFQEKNITEITETTLSEQFEVLGDLAHPHKTSCAVVIRSSGFVPPTCDCTMEANTRRLAWFNTNDHGVKTHGSSYQWSERELRSFEILRPEDEHLYQMGRRVFARQVEELEKEFGIRICDERQ